jgi:hypothetical protein
VKQQLRRDVVERNERVLREGDPLLGGWLADEAPAAAAGLLEPD